jgi:O-acetyl-ADP-ribose deacetylase (regulator of RNase III)
MTHTYAGPTLRIETTALPGRPGHPPEVKLLTGEAIVTAGHALQSARYIVHVVTPYFDGDRPQPALHMRCCEAVLGHVDGVHVRRLIIGPVSTGYYGYPMLEAAVLFFRVLRRLLVERPEDVDEVGLWIYCDTQRAEYAHLLRELLLLGDSKSELEAPEPVY